jgi:ATP/maltotriose-dependent transcriptional regulator MalT
MAMMMADWMLGVSHHLLGDQASALKHCETALNLAPIQNSSLLCSGYDQRIRALVMLARALWLLGYASRAVTVATQALDQANALDHPLTLCFCDIHRATLLLWTGDWSEADRIIDQLIARSEKYSLGLCRVIGLGLKGKLSLLQGDTEAGLRLLKACLNASEAGQFQALTAIFTSDLAIGLAGAARPDEANAAIEQVMAACGEPTRRDFYLPEVMRIKGEILASGPEASEAETWFSRSLDLAREQSALAWELRTATSLARLLARQGRCDEATRVLRPVYDRFTEGFDTSDLGAAKRLLDKLRFSCAASDKVETASRQFG